jgi:hypothetical protein
LSFDDGVEGMRVMLGLVLLEVDFDRERSFLKNILQREKSRLRGVGDGRRVESSVEGLKSISLFYVMGFGVN